MTTHEARSTDDTPTTPTASLLTGRTAVVTGGVADQARTRGIPEDEVVQQVLLAESAVKRLTEPEEVAALATWLAADAAGMVTGASYSMDGGWTAG